jgi:hypothetical protein
MAPPADDPDAAPGETIAGRNWLVPACGAETMLGGVALAFGACGESGKIVLETDSHPASKGAPKMLSASTVRIGFKWRRGMLSTSVHRKDRTDFGPGSNKLQSKES